MNRKEILVIAEAIMISGLLANENIIKTWTTGDERLLDCLEDFKKYLQNGGD